MPSASDKKINDTSRTVRTSISGKKSPRGISTYFLDGSIVAGNKDLVNSSLPVTLKGIKKAYSSSYSISKKLFAKSPKDESAIKSPSTIKSPLTSDASLIPINEAELTNSNIFRPLAPDFLLKSTNPTETLKPQEKPNSENAGLLPVGITYQRGVKFEFYLSIFAGLIFIGLWIYLMTTYCYQDLDKLFWIKTFSLIGAVMSFFVAVYCCFEKQESSIRGLANCVFFTSLVTVGSMNLIGAYLAINCLCTCTTNAVRELGEDMLIFVLEMLGSISLFLTLMIASLANG